MANYAQMVNLVRRKSGQPVPMTGGEDKLDSNEIIEYLNNAFDQMCDAVYGFDRYVEFTITAAGVIAVTDPTTNPPTVALRADPAGGSYPVYYVSDARSYEKVENKTAEVVDDARRIMVERTLNDPAMQDTYATATNYYGYYSIQGTRGFTLLPPISETNTIGITYRRRFIRYSVGDVTQTTGTGLNDITVTGIYEGTDGATTQYRVKITTQGVQDKFKFSTDGGVTYSAAEYNCSTTGTDIGNGFTVTFAAITGHTLNDVWSWAATAPLLTVFKEEEQRGFPVLRAAAECARDLDDTRYGYWLAECLGVGWPKEIGGLLGAFKEARFSEDLTLEEGLGE